MGSPLHFNAEHEAERIRSFIAKETARAGASGVVLGLSGGVDSSVVCALSVGALGADRVLGILLPSKSTPPEDVHDAKTLAKSLGIPTRLVDIGGQVAGLRRLLKDEGTRIAVANLQARLRMTSLYYYANSLGRLVAGTGDRSEMLVGFFTKWGDGGVDFLPIAHLYKTQVRALGRQLGLPDRITSKPASPQLWPGHKATDELPLDYDKLDLILHYLFDERLGPGEAAGRAGVAPSLVARVLEMNSRSAHKRALPPTLLVPKRV